jgi:hypothetical protein
MGVLPLNQLPDTREQYDWCKPRRVPAGVVSWISVRNAIVGSRRLVSGSLYSLALSRSMANSELTQGS